MNFGVTYFPRNLANLAEYRCKLNENCMSASSLFTLIYHAGRKAAEKKRWRARAKKESTGNCAHCESNNSS